MSKKILIVDDSPTMLMSMSSVLTKSGYEVAQANSGAEAVKAVEAGAKPALVITDYHMPGMTGDSLARRLRKVRPDIPIILFTGFSSEISEETAREAGIEEIVPKPVLASQLTMAIRRVLETARRD